MQRYRVIAIAVLSLVAVVAVLQNTDPVRTRFLLFTLETPQAVLLFVTLGIGFVLGILTAARFGGVRPKPVESAR